MIEKLKSEIDPLCYNLLSRYPYTAGQCVPISALASEHLFQSGISNEVWLGSLRCNGIKAFSYTRAFPVRPRGPVDWEGHAWIVLGNGFILDLSILRTARVAPESSNLRRAFERRGLLSKGVLGGDRTQMAELGLKYSAKKLFKRKAYLGPINGLRVLHSEEAVTDIGKAL